MRTVKEIEDYLRKSLGLETSFLKHLNTNNLPIYLRRRFELMGAELYGTSVIIAIEKARLSHSPFEIKKTVDLLTEKLQKPVIYCVSELAGLEINRLIKYRVQFIVPGKQLYLPQFLISLKNRAVTQSIQREFFTPVTQCTFIYMIKSDISQFTISEVAEVLGYTKMSISRAFTEMENPGIIKSRNMGRTKFVEFSDSKEHVFKSVTEFLINPIISKKFVRILNDELYHSIPAAGLTALAEYSMINDDKIKTLACRQKSFDILVQKKIVKEVPFKEEADINLELWSYDPAICEKFHSKTVDPLSLFASLREETDERVAKALDLLMEKITW